MQRARRLGAALAALAGSGCGVVFPTGNYVDSCQAKVDSGPTCGAAMPSPPGYDACQIVFQDSFCGTALDSTKWLRYVPGFTDMGVLPFPLSGPNSGSFNGAYWDPSQVTVNSGLKLTAVADTNEAGYTAKSGVITSNGVQFAGGPTGHTYLQVRAKVPAANGMWPIASLGPVVGSNALPITLLATGFTDATPGSPLENFETGVSNSKAYCNTGNTDLSQAFVDYGVEVVWGQSATWFWSPVGGPRQQCETETVDAGVAVPSSSDGETLIIQLNVVNGLDGSTSWHTVWNGSDSDSLQVAAVQVYAR